METEKNSCNESHIELHFLYIDRRRYRARFTALRLHIAYAGANLYRVQGRRKKNILNSAYVPLDAPPLR